MNLRELLRIWAIMTSRRRRQLVLQFFGMVVTAALEFTAISCIPLFVLILNQLDTVTARPDVSALMDFFGITTPGGFLYLFGAFIIGVFLLKGLVTTLVLWGQARLLAGIISDLSRSLFAAYLQAPYTYLTSRNTAVFTNLTIGESTRMIQGFVLPFLQFMLAAMLLCALIMIVLVTDPVLGLGVAAFAGIGGYLYARSNRARLHQHGTAMTMQTRSMIQKLNEALGGYKHIKLRGLEEKVYEDFHDHLEKRAVALRSTRFITEVSKPIFETAGLVTLIVLVMILLSSGRSQETVVPTLTMLGAVAVRALPALFGMTRTISTMRSNAVAADNVLTELETLGIRTTDSRAQVPVPSQDHGPVGDITLRNVCVRYPEATANALDDITLEIPSGSSVAFVGPTGSGKSTTVDTILGFVDVASGDIQVGGRSVLGKEAMRAWQSRVGYIPQSIYLTDATVRRNVAMGVPADEIDEAAVWRALEDAQLADYVREKLPEGLDTIVGERGVRLSGGQRQRIGIARALYHDPAVLVLDEATSALDNETENKVIAAIENAKRGRTLIMIAHRLSTVRNCDTIFFLRDGKIVAQGPYDELLGQNADFSRMAAVV